MITSRWMNRSVSKASASRVAVTDPSIMFSIATRPKSTSPLLTAFSTSMIELMGRWFMAARSGWE